MSQLSHLPVIPSVYSFAQRWCPIATREAGQEPVRGRIAILMDESQNLCVAMELLPDLMTPAQTRDWLVRELSAPSNAAAPAGRPEELLLEREELVSALRFTLQPAGIKLRLEQRPGALDHFLLRMSEELGREDEFSLADDFGRERAVRVYRSAERFFQAEPWKKIPNGVVLQYSRAHSPGKDVGVLVLGSGHEEYGLSLFHSPEQGLAMMEGRPVFPYLGFGLHTPAFVPWLDLDLIERHDLRFPLSQFPWFLAPHGVLDETELADLEWLLENVPRLATVEDQVRDEGHWLRAYEPPVTSEQAVAHHLLRCWGRKSHKAQELAEFLASQFCGLKPGPREFETMLNHMVLIGFDYLASVRSRSLDPDYFQGPPPDNVPYGRTWKRLVKQFQHQMKQLSQYRQALRPTLPLLFALLQARREHGAAATRSPEVQQLLAGVRGMPARQRQRAYDVLMGLPVPEGYSTSEFVQALTDLSKLLMGHR